ncbi:SWI/SNF and RSC complex subunit Ssr2 [Vermiconidia calcicola]|uniref:SWI/SNF and RSC complex subunit Ssr2 n=1 Tax=Vermiconidia calcicola TaxID=1690605 RepID=A0ACC3MQB1_9PEZI|nr:SWI/SNF and RSC complex subunit Ssr2 [Vermiconidia calcicola]
MSYAQLLDPKGFEKSKRKATNYGPQQVRKPASSTQAAEPKSTPTKFDSKALLNPKAAFGRSKNTPANTAPNGSAFEEDMEQSSATVDDGAADHHLGMSDMIERQYNVTKRDAPPPKKRKSEVLGDDEEDAEHKKAKSTFNASTTSGPLGDYLKSQREKGAAEVGPSTDPIDLTNDDEDEVVFVSESIGDGSKEVCLGRLHVQANAYRIPRPRREQNGSVGSNMWPQTRANFRRIQAKDHIIELYDSTSGGGAGAKFGTVDFKAASAICPLLDGSNVNKLKLKIFVDPFKRQKNESAGSKVSRHLSLSIMLYAPRDKARGIGTFLSQKGLFLSAPLNTRGVEYYNPHVPETLGAPRTMARKPQSSQLTYGVNRTQEEMVREASNMFDKLVNHADLPEMEPDVKIILTPLMEHQKQALYFLTEHERASYEESNDDSRFSLWKSRTTNRGQIWYNIVTNHELKQEPESVRGGILADMMGLGKTLSILALITNTLDEARAFGETWPPNDMGDVERNAKATLIICPKSVLSNWAEQVKLHTRPDRLKVFTYHGSNRTQDLEELAKHNIVLTSYSTAAVEFGDKSRKRNALASIQWFRIVLDEAHQIRTQSTQVSQACCALYAQRRWAVTGTPVQNRLDDLGALIKFLRIKPFDDGKAWAQHILLPFKNGNEEALQHLRLIVDGVTLRRQKDKIGLKERRENRIRLDFSDEEMVIYSQFSKASNLKLQLMMKNDNRLRGKSYAHVLKSLSRLRAICAHGREMLNDDDLQELEGLTAGTAIELGDEPEEGPDDTFITDRHAYETLHMMVESEVDQCISCSRKIGDRKVDPDAAEDTPDDSEDEDESAASSAGHDTMGYLTPCYHLICPGCKDKFINNAVPKLTSDHYHVCSYCENYVRFGLFKLHRSGLKSMLDARNNANKKAAKWDESTYSGPHTKVKALLDDLKQSANETAQLPAGEPPIRSVVFSGWTTYLDLIEYALEENNIGFVRLDGKMSVKARSQVLETFKTDHTANVLLVSIKAGGQGLNFTSASKVYMMEPQFNPGVEQQAIDRVHRLGQKRDVDIKHYIMRDTVEEKILDLQVKKEKLANLSMEKKLSKGEEAKQKMEGLKDLFK